MAVDGWRAASSKPSRLIYITNHWCFFASQIHLVRINCHQSKFSIDSKLPRGICSYKFNKVKLLRMHGECLLQDIMTIINGWMVWWASAAGCRLAGGFVNFVKGEKLFCPFILSRHPSTCTERRREMNDTSWPGSHQQQKCDRTERYRRLTSESIDRSIDGG